MNFSKMKPLPKAIVIFVPIALAVAGANWYLEHRPKKVEAPKVEAVAVPPEAEAAKTVEAPAQPAPTPAPAQVAEPAPGLTPAGGQDGGLNAVLKAGKK